MKWFGIIAGALISAPCTLGGSCMAVSGVATLSFTGFVFGLLLLASGLFIWLVCATKFTDAGDTD